MYILIICICIRLSFVVTEEQLNPIVKLAAKIRNLSELCNFYTPFLYNSTADTMFWYYAKNTHLFANKRKNTPCSCAKPASRLFGRITCNCMKISKVHYLIRFAGSPVCRLI